MSFIDKFFNAKAMGLILLLCFGMISNSSAQLCTVGTKSRFFWPQDNKWYAGTVIEAASDQCKVTWTGYGRNQDSWVTPQNMRLLVLWTDGKRYPATVIRKQGNKYLVKYDQYDASYNEVVELRQLSVRPQ